MCKDRKAKQGIDGSLLSFSVLPDTKHTSPLRPTPSLFSYLLPSATTHQCPTTRYFHHVATSYSPPKPLPPLLLLLPLLPRFIIKLLSAASWSGWLTHHTNPVAKSQRHYDDPDWRTLSPNVCLRFSHDHWVTFYPSRLGEGSWHPSSRPEGLGNTSVDWMTVATISITPVKKTKTIW